MKALTIFQPYAELILSGQKRIENRTWRTAYRGLVLLHAGKSTAWLATETRLPERMDFGAIVGVFQLVGCVRFGATLPANLAWIDTHPHASGPWCWIIGEVRRFVPAIPYRGGQGLFHVPDDVVRGMKFIKAGYQPEKVKPNGNGHDS